MPIIDYSTPTGKLRMRLGDVSDLPFIPDSIYAQVYSDCDNNLQRSVVLCGTMILAQLSFKTHRKLAQLEIYGSEGFANFKQFLLMAISNPAFMDISPLPPNIFGTDLHPIMQFTKDWNDNFSVGTQSTQLHWDALGSPNNATGNWQWDS